MTTQVTNHITQGFSLKDTCSTLWCGYKYITSNTVLHSLQTHCRYKYVHIIGFDITLSLANPPVHKVSRQVFSTWQSTSSSWNPPASSWHGLMSSPPGSSPASISLRVTMAVKVKERRYNCGRLDTIRRLGKKWFLIEEMETWWCCWPLLPRPSITPDSWAGLTYKQAMSRLLRN